MASLPGGGDAAAAAAASAGGMLPLATSPSLAGLAQQAPLSAPVQLPLNLSSLQSQLLMPLGGGAAAGSGQPLDAYFPLALQHQQQQAQQQLQHAQHVQQHFLHQHAPGGGGVAGQLPQLALPFQTGGGGGGMLAGLPLNWPIPGDASGASVQVVQLPPCSSGILNLPQGELLGQPHGQGPVAPQQQQQQHQGLQQVAQQQQYQQQAPEQAQQALSAPQIMSNTDHNGSTEGTQAWAGGGGARRGSGRGGGTARSPMEADESGAAESRLKAAPSGRRGRGGGEPGRKSRFR